MGEGEERETESTGVATKRFSKRFLQPQFCSMAVEDGERKNGNFLLKNNNGTFLLRLRAQSESAEKSRREINSKASLHRMLARGRSSRNLNRAREREAWRAPRFHCFIHCWEWTNINFAFESVISTFRCLFICHILEAFPGEKGFLFSRSLLFVIKSILLSRTRGGERWTAGAWSG